MFKFLKNKLKSAVEKFSQSAEEDAETVENEVVQEKSVVAEPQVQQNAKENVIQEDIKEQQEQAPVPEHKREQFQQKVEAKSNAQQQVANKIGMQNKIEEKLKQKREEKVVKDQIKEVAKDQVKDKIERKDKIHAAVQQRRERQHHKEDAKQQVVQKIEKKGIIKSLFGKKKEEKQTKKEQQETVLEETKWQEETQSKKGILGSVTSAITQKKLSEEKFESLFFELEITLLENNVALEVVEKIKNDLRRQLVETKINRGQIADVVISSLAKSIREVLSIESANLLEKINAKQDKPYVIAFFGINGSGKTTTLAKLAAHFKEQGKSVVLGACDTYRAAAIDQLQHHADALALKVIKHDYGADPSAVAFDAIAHAKAKDVDVVLLDTAGRLHQNENLMAELEKLMRVAQPDFRLFVGESITGNDCVEQARLFNEKIGFDGSILTKVDVDEKGGAPLSISYVTQKPILYIGTGQTYADLKPFDSKAVLENLGLEA